MKTTFIGVTLYILSFLISLTGFATTTYTVGASGASYTTIAAAYAVCTGSTDYVIEIKSNYNQASETWPLALTQLANKSAVNTVTIRPEAGTSVSVSQSVAGNLIYFNGADYVIIDGRAGGTGSTSAMTLTNTSTNSAATVFLFGNNATYNTIKYCSIQGSSSGSTSGVVYFSSGSSGNNNNTITSNTITKAGSNNPTSAIFSYGNGSGTENANITISNNNIVDFLRHGVHCYAYSTGWTISGNSFYQSASLTLTADMIVIYTETSGFGGTVTNFTITGNYIGGQAASCGGSAYTLSSSAYVFTGISVEPYSSGTITISGNTIQNITMTSTATGTLFKGISTSYVSTDQTITIGSSGNGNVIGATTGTGSINITSAAGSAITNGFVAFYTSCGSPTTIAYNSVGGINYSTTSTAKGSLYMIYHGATGSSALTVNNNTFGNTTASNIALGTGAYSMFGIYIQSMTGAITVNNNTFQNWTNSGNTGTGDYIVNIATSSPGNINVYSNSISTFSSAGTFGFAAFYFGSSINTSNAINFYRNSISGFSKTATSGSVYGLYFSYSSGTGNPTISVYKNRFVGLANASTTASDWCAGMYFNIAAGSSVSANVYNNVIVSNDGGNTTAKTLRGILDYIQGASVSVGVYHNTIKLYATYTGGTGTSAAFTFNGTGTHYIKNNVWQNLSSGGSGVYQAQRYLQTTTLSNVSNNYNESSSAASLIYYNSANRTLATWQGASYTNTTTEITGASVNTDNTTGEPATDAYIGNAGTPIGLVTDDFNAAARDLTAPWIGAFETAVSLPVELLYFSAELIGEKNQVRLDWETATENKNDFFTIERSQNGFDFHPITIVEGQGDSYRLTKYETIDVDPLNGISYYRLRQTDLDGASTVSKIVSINRNKELNSLVIFPNPNKGSEFSIYFENEKNEGVLLEITDEFGKLRYRSEIQSNDFIPFSSSLEKGVYFVSIIKRDDKQTTKMVVQ